MTPVDLEQAVLDLEHVRIVVRAPINAPLGDFSFARKAAANASIAEWLEQRIIPLVEGFPVAVIDGSGISPNRRTKMSTLRESYAN